MNNSKFVQILKTFDKKELQEFEKFIISPVYNAAGVYVVRFYSEVKKFYPDFDDPSFTRERIYKKLYPSGKYNDSTLRKLSSELMKLCEEFLIFRNFSNRSYLRDRLLLQEFEARHLNRLFEIRSQKSSGQSDKAVFRDAEYFHERFLSTILIKKFYFNRDRKKSIKYFNDEVEYLTMYYTLYMLRAYIERLREKRSFTDTDFNLPMFDEILKYTNRSGYLSIDSFRLFRTELELYIGGGDNVYSALKQLKNKFQSKLPVDDLNSIYTTLVNYATERSESGRKEFLRDVFELYKESLKRKIIGSYFSEFQFINIVTVSLRLKEHKFAESFIKKYPQSLNPDIREDVVNYCRANLSFSKKDFRQTMEYLLKINFKYGQHKFLIKNLTLKTYYELKQYESIYLLIDAYKHLLKREKLVPSNIKKLIGNFIGFVKELADLKNGKGDKPEILNRVKKTTTAETLWLTEKLSS